MMKPLCTLAGLLLLQTLAGAQVTDTSVKWTWKAGTTGSLQGAVYGTKGTAYPLSSGQTPGARTDNFTWTSKDGKLYTFGGFYNLQNTFNDIWRFDPDANTWTWVHGTSGYTTQGPVKDAIVSSAAGVPHADNVPGCRANGVQWVDSDRNLWVFGGLRVQNGIRRNDLWKYETATNQWTWLNGNTANVAVAGVYGTKGTASPTNQPGSRGYGAPAGWFDHNEQKLYMFGGTGHDKNNTNGLLDDMWVYDIKNKTWTWIGGSDVVITTNQNVKYGTRGVEDKDNWPLGRQNGAYWQDQKGMFWMFGGNSAVNGLTVYMNDLWRFNPKTQMWAWMGGDTVLQANGHNNVSGIRGLPSASNKPGGRQQVLSQWVDVQGKLWMYGGYGRGHNGTVGRLNDMWCYDPQTGLWTWMLGDNDPGSANGRAGTYSSVGNAGVPGARRQSTPWVDNDGNFWFLGGEGAANTSSAAYRSDLWKLEGLLPPTPAQPGLFTSAKPRVCTRETGLVYSIPAVAGATSYEWKYNGAGLTFAASTTVPSNTISIAAVATTGNLSVRAVNAAGPGPWRDTLIVVNASPTFTITPTGTQTICDGSKVTLALSGFMFNASYQWKNGTTNVGINNPSYDATTSGSYTLTITGTTSGCSTTSDPVQVNVIPTPTVSVSPATVTICAGESTTLTASGATTYSWSPAGGTAASATVTPGTTTTYTVTGTTNGCSGTATRTVTVNPLPVVNVTNTGAREICDGDSLLLTASSGGSVNYQWKNGTNNVATGANFYAKTSGTYTVTVTNPTTNCAVTSSPATVLTVNPVPTATIAAGGPTDICAGSVVTLNATQVSGAAYQWLHNGNNVGTNANNHDAAATGAYQVRVSYPATGCSDISSTIDVNVFNRPSVRLLPGDTAFCEGGILKLEVETQDTGLTFRWLNNGNVVPQASADFLEINASGVYKVEVGHAAIAGCDSLTNEVTVTVHPLPVVNTTWDGATLHATQGFSSYQWFAAGQPIPGATNDTYSPQSEGGFSVTAVDSNGCSNSSPVYNVKLGLNNLTAAGSQIMIYPNPVRDMIYIESPVEFTVILSSMDGKQILNQHQATSINMTSYPAGMYHLRITDTNGAVLKNEKLIKLQ